MKDAKMIMKYILYSMISTMSMSLYILADTFFIAKGVGPLGIAALNVVLPVYNLMFAISLMLGIGSATLYTLHKEQYPALFSQTIRISILIGLLFTIAGTFFSKEIVILLQGNEAVVPYASTYLRILLFYSVFFMLNNVISPFTRNDGNPKLASIAMMIASFSNIVLDYILIIHFNMGMAGAALATGVSPVISLMILYLHKHYPNLASIGGKPTFFTYPLRKVASGGIGALIIELSSGITIIALNAYLFRIADESAVAIYGIIANVALLVIGMFVGIGQGIQPLVSVYHRNHHEYGKRLALTLGIFVSLIISLGLIFLNYQFPQALPTIFLPDYPELSALLIQASRLYFISFVFAGLNIVIVAYFQSMLLFKPSLLITLLRGAIGTLIILPISVALWQLPGIFVTVSIVEISAWILCVILLTLHFSHR